MQTIAVTRQHLDIGQKMVAEGDGLRHLKMGKARHGVGGMLQRARGERAHERRDLTADAVNGVAYPEAEIGRHLIIARARRVQPLAGLADALGKARFDIHVNIFKVLREGEIPGLDIAGDPMQPVTDFLLFGFGQQSDACQHGGMGKRAAYILTP